DGEDASVPVIRAAGRLAGGVAGAAAGGRVVCRCDQRHPAARPREGERGGGSYGAAADDGDVVASLARFRPGFVAPGGGCCIHGGSIGNAPPGGGTRGWAPTSGATTACRRLVLAAPWDSAILRAPGKGSCFPGLASHLARMAK